jgi:hypothetical protein
MLMRFMTNLLKVKKPPLTIPGNSGGSDNITPMAKFDQPISWILEGG